jgi:hypothetical protein
MVGLIGAPTKKRKKSSRVKKMYLRIIYFNTLNLTSLRTNPSMESRKDHWVNCMAKSKWMTLRSGTNWKHFLINKLKRKTSRGWKTTMHIKLPWGCMNQWMMWQLKNFRYYNREHLVIIQDKILMRISILRDIHNHRQWYSNNNNINNICLKTSHQEEV